MKVIYICYYLFLVRRNRKSKSEYCYNKCKSQRIMNTKFFSVIFFLAVSVPVLAQMKGSGFTTTGNENYALINISRSNTYQEVRGSGKLIQVVYINDQPVCEINCPGRVSIKVYSEGKLNLTVKYLPNKKIKQKVIDKNFLSGPPLEIEVTHGKTYFANTDLKLKEGALQAYFTGKLVSISESEGMFNDEERFKKDPQIKEYQEDINKAFIRK